MRNTNAFNKMAKRQVLKREQDKGEKSLKEIINSGKGEIPH